MRRILVLMAVAVVAGQAQGVGPVIVISVDGLRPDAIPATSTPVLDAPSISSTSMQWPSRISTQNEH